ncbi:MAG: hypothetical protein A4S09_15175 [Proteobacteria bacterium SG_bin7]|nr:MAG: hypothetical protein A4S09_15175 [Proteobacteria bacterium SG_bin7]
MKGIFMEKQYFDILVAKKYKSKVTGQPEKRTKWNRVGRAWLTKSGESLSFELFILPNVCYLIQSRNKKPDQENNNA